jgi:aryl-alcohol dehydrogenase-like predicted oxidoreductase
MEYRQLGRSDLKVSALGMGCATFGREIDEATSFAVMDRALERGITLFDTAEAYSAGRSEEIVGNWIASRGVRDQIVLATKVTFPLGRERVIASSEASLRRLKVDVIDLFQLHTFDANTPLEETLEALDVVVHAGTARYIGCSNFAAWQLTKALWRCDVNHWTRFESIQPVYNLAIRDIEKEILPLCADQEIGVITYSPLGAGFLTGKYRKGDPVPPGTRFDIVPGHQSIYFNDCSYLRMEQLREVAAKYGLPMARLGMAWVLSRSGVTCTLVGARSVEQVDQAFDALELAQSPGFAEIANELAI